MSVVVIDNQMVHYETLGRGRPLVFLHGWVGSWRYWIPVMQAASVSYRAYAMDLWGFGDTAKAQENYHLDQQVALIDHFLYEMGIGRVALVGHGLGAIVAARYALQHPDLVDRVMAVSYPMDANRIHPRLRSAAPAELADWLLTRTTLTEPVRADAPKTDARAISTSFSSMNGLGVRDVSASMQTSCLFVNGLNDQAVLAPDLEQVAALPPCSHMVGFEQSGHFPMLDEGSKFNRLMADFLALPSGDSPRQLLLKEEWRRRVR